MKKSFLRRTSTIIALLILLLSAGIHFWGVYNSEETSAGYGTGLTNPQEIKIVLDAYHLQKQLTNVAIAGGIFGLGVLCIPLVRKN
ncbi:hypothetical protein P9J64_13595 [Deltaproteobacteria bacterium IMCC39524]|nr:hypothetical protein [Deltaproteobacteria bacterium IMCC39524]